MNNTFSNEDDSQISNFSCHQIAEILVQQIAIAQNAITYRLFKSKSDIADKDTYGISVKSAFGKNLNEDKIVDITTNYTIAQKLFNSIIDGFVTPITFKDVVEDYLTKIYSYD